ncbi:MAG: hypothetical protein KIH64_016255 [Mycobacterium sp.]|nr:hypothetical protein [Mycobacterium sp.]
MTTASAKLQLGVATMAVAAAAAIAPVVAPISHAAPSIPAPAQVLVWGSDDLDPALLAQLNDAPEAAAVGVTANAATPGPIAQLIIYTVQGIAKGIQGVARGTVVVGGTVVYASLAFTGGVLTTVGNVLPGPIGNVFTNIGEATTQVANNVAEAIHIGPYGTVA